MAAPKGEKQQACKLCGRVGTKATRNAYIQCREEGFIVWVAVCNKCKLESYVSS